MSYPQFPQQPQQHGWQSGEPPLWAPYYRAPFPAAIKRFFKKYATFSGRASRSEYWWWALVWGGVVVILSIIVEAGNTAATTSASSLNAQTSGPAATIGTMLMGFWVLATVVPDMALTVRRLHDVNMSGWLVLLGIVPFLGGLVLLVFTILPSDPNGQRFDRPS